MIKCKPSKLFWCVFSWFNFYFCCITVSFCHLLEIQTIAAFNFWRKWKGQERKMKNMLFLWKYSQGDYDCARFLIDSTNRNLLLPNDIHTSLHNWQNQFLLIIEKCIPRVHPSRRRHPWLTNRIIIGKNLKPGKNKSSRLYEPSIYLNRRISRGTVCENA